MDSLKEKGEVQKAGVSGGEERDEVLARVLARRGVHREKSLFVRVGVVVGGGLLSLFAALLAVVAPEFGLPLLLVGLRLLALEFDWAARLYTKVSKLARKVAGTLRRLWPKSKVGVAVMVIGLVVVGYLVFTAIR